MPDSHRSQNEDEKTHFWGLLNVLMYICGRMFHLYFFHIWNVTNILLFWVSTYFTSLSHLHLSGMPRFASQPSAANVHLGSTQVMACEVNSDLVPFTRWEKDRLPLELSTRLVQLPSGALVISNASEADAGLYRCLVDSVGSSKSSDEAQLQVLPGNLRKLSFDRQRNEMKCCY